VSDDKSYTINAKSGTVRLRDRVYTMARAEALGYVARMTNGEWVLTTLGRESMDYAGAKEAERAARAAWWRIRQGLDKPPERRRKAEASAKAEPLRPQNVTKDGEPITDEKVLAKIVQKTNEKATKAGQNAQPAKEGTTDDDTATDHD
jgi:hypothetical protein